MGESLPFPALPPPPRSVRRRQDPSNFGFNIFRLFIVPFILVGIACFAAAGFHLLVSRFGLKVIGIVDTVNTRVDSDNSSVTYMAAYHYPTPAGIQHGHAQISAVVAPICQPGSTIPLRRFAMFGFDITVLDPSQHSPLIWGLPIFAGVWNAFILPVAYFLFVRPIRIKKLIATGDAVIGSIVHVTKNSEGYRRVGYEFSPKNSQRLTARAWLHDSVPFTYDVGTPITVIYDLARPRRSVIYETSNWEIEQSSYPMLKSYRHR